MITLAILIPVLRRPKNVLPLVSSIVENTPGNYEILFIVSPGDQEETNELEVHKQNYIVMDAIYVNNGDYARKINTGFNSIEAEWYFLGADDILFQPNWFESAMETYQQTNASVIGTNDLGSPSVMRGEHATHSLVRRDYVLNYGTIDQPGLVLHEGYHHNYCDIELVGTAKYRKAWAFSRDSVVRHIHPDWGLAVTDDVYQIGKRSFREDYIYNSRRKFQWNNL